MLHNCVTAQKNEALSEHDQLNILIIYVEGFYFWMTSQVREKLNKTERTVAHQSLSYHLKEIMRET